MLRVILHQADSIRTTTLAELFSSHPPQRSGFSDPTHPRSAGSCWSRRHFDAIIGLSGLIRRDYCWKDSWYMQETHVHTDKKYKCTLLIRKKRRRRSAIIPCVFRISEFRPSAQSLAFPSARQMQKPALKLLSGALSQHTPYASAARRGR